MTKKQAKKKLEQLILSLNMCRYRAASVFPGPGWEEDEARLMREIKKLRKEYNL